MGRRGAREWKEGKEEEEEQEKAESGKGERGGEGGGREWTLELANDVLCRAVESTSDFINMEVVSH